MHFIVDDRARYAENLQVAIERCILAVTDVDSVSRSRYRGEADRSSVVHVDNDLAHLQADRPSAYAVIGFNEHSRSLVVRTEQLQQGVGVAAHLTKTVAVKPCFLPATTAWNAGRLHAAHTIDRRNRPACLPAASGD